MIEKKWYYVQDEFGFVWNIEPFTTFMQAYHFKEFIRFELRGYSEVFIRSCSRVEETESITADQQPVTKKDRYANSDF